MKSQEEKNHPRLLMLDGFDGKIEGELKYHKCLYKYRYNALEERDWSFKREERGPTDPGFTSIMQSMDDLDLVNGDSSEATHVFNITSKGKGVAKGLKRGLSKLDPTFDGKLDIMTEIAKRDKHRSGSEIVEDEEIQEAKEETYQSDV
jgi:hypothetical protein